MSGRLADLETHGELSESTSGHPTVETIQCDWLERLRLQMVMIFIIRKWSI